MESSRGSLSILSRLSALKTQAPPLPLRCAEDCASRDSTHPAHGRPLGLPLLQQNTNHRE